MICELSSDAGLLSGLWDGLFAVFSLFGDIFFNFEVYNRCQDSWLYDLGFIVGLILLGWLSVKMSLFVIPIIFVIWILTLLFKPLIWGAGLALGVFFVYFIYDEYFKKSPS